MTLITDVRTPVRIEAVSKVFGRGADATVALDNVDLTVEEGEFVCLLGASGCGKSTLLAMIAALDEPTTGVIDLGGRRTAVMFQDANLFPWLTVQGNIELALRFSGVPRSDWAARVRELLAVVRLPGAARKRPHELSGGMRQRVALARSLAQEAEVLLMDEPFAALDAITRDALHAELERIVRERGLTVIFVTHNVREAARLGDRVLVMKPSPGRIVHEERIDLPRPRQMEDPAVAVRAGLLRDELETQDAGTEVQG
ncbi:ABC transporter ATP-binding protein [Amnibacterium sp. CER49]|uniref:ABC transporter ATP-binding protein n=1 Tax=Amnibacterium sp. CER49 TaxID=3039161 RepID=UPI00244A4B22|nr:ABC transporter ATP-binding protein [Amnibacterium sp. CER49]MDH2444521.1 ABC transporter ATP-binding protein [Amnibacterium sp. CER49]